MNTLVDGGTSNLLAPTHEEHTNDTHLLTPSSHPPRQFERSVLCQPLKGPGTHLLFAQTEQPGETE